MNNIIFLMVYKMLSEIKVISTHTSISIIVECTLPNTSRESKCAPSCFQFPGLLNIDGYCITDICRTYLECTDHKTTDVWCVNNVRSNRLHQDLNYTIRCFQNVIQCTSIMLYNPDIYNQSMFIEQVTNL